MIKKSSKSLFLFIFIIVFLAIVFLVYMNFQFHTPKSNDTTLYEITIKEGEGVNEISYQLASQNIIRSSFYFDLYVWLKKKENELKAGTYKVSQSMSIAQIVDLIVSGKAEEIKIVIYEGMNSKQIASYLEEEANIKADDFLKEIKKQSYSAEYEFLKDKPWNASLEGYLFPDTYMIYTEAEPSTVVQKMLANFDVKFSQDLRQEIKRQGKSLFEVITMASIVQNEVKKEEEMKKVAGVYYNRLEADLALESDATITFITGKKDPQPSDADTQIDSPYNTYINKGLPPGPIGNPGLKAILATIYPEDHDYYFFITRLDSGEAIFSKTAKEHEEMKAKYLAK